MLNNFLTEIMLLAGLGVLLDSVFITEKEREKIAAYLESGTDDLTLSQRFSNFLARAHSVIFGRFFSARLFSRGFFLSAAVISICSFCLVLGAQVYLFPDQFSQLRYDTKQLVLFLVFILFNISFDYATIIQTKIFIETALKVNSIFRALVLIVSDLIVTMNTFILSYALFVLVVVQAFVAAPEPASLIATESAPNAEVEPRTDRRAFDGLEEREFAERLVYSGNLTAALLSREDEQEADNILLPYLSTFDPRMAETKVYTFARLALLNISDIDASVIEDEGERKVYFAALDELKSDLQRQLDGEPDDETGLVRLNFSIDASVFGGGSLSGAYTAAFFLTDQLEDSFPASVAAPMELPQLSTLIKNAVAAPTSQDATVLCFKDGLPTLRFKLTSATVEVLGKCSDFMVVDSFWANRIDADFALVGRDTDGYRVPFNTLLITSMLPTASFYLAIILLAIVTVCYSKVVRGTNRIKKLFLRAPFAISGALLGAVMSLVGLI